ncbi:MAG: hypothetical protein ABSF79_06150 [Smithellaceae bacterium]|jgi:hypothetical protein
MYNLQHQTLCGFAWMNVSSADFPEDNSSKTPFRKISGARETFSVKDSSRVVVIQLKMTLRIISGKAKNMIRGFNVLRIFLPTPSARMISIGKPERLGDLGYRGVVKSLFGFLQDF